MVKGFCPNRECPNIDILDLGRRCPSCGSELEEVTPREYWRARTIKMMHEREVAVITEIEEAARKSPDEASLVPEAEESEKTPAPEELERIEEVDSALEAAAPDSTKASETDDQPVEFAGETESSEEVVGSGVVGEIEPSGQADLEIVGEERSEETIQQKLEQPESLEPFPAEHGIESPSSALRIITFGAEGGDIGICPYCGLFIKSSDLRRHKLKCRVRNALGIQAGD